MTGFEPHERVLETDGSIAPLSDADDAVRILEDDPAQLHFEEVRDAMLEIMRRDTGDTAPAKVRREAEERAAELMRTSVEICEGLERAGRPMWRQSEFQIWTWYVHSKRAEAVPLFRRSLANPWVAKKVRGPKLAAAEFFLQSRPFARMWVMSSGELCRLRDLRERLSVFHRRLSRLNSEVLRPYGLEIALRSTELGMPECDEHSERSDAGEIKRAPDGEPLFHVHAHLIVHHRNGRPLRPERWEQALRAVWSFWPAWWGDSGSLRGARETVKYITKPGEILKLTDAEKRQLAEAIEGMKIVQPMGALLAEIRSRRDRCMTLDRAPTPEGRIWREVFDWNRWFSPRLPKKPEAWKETAKEIATELEAKERARRGLPPVDADRPDKRAEWTRAAVETAVERVFSHPGGRDGEREIEARIVARLVPGFAPGSDRREPRVLVLARRIDPAEIAAHPLVAELERETRDEWLAGEAVAAAISVHTCTPTVRSNPAGSVRSRAAEHSPPAVGPPVLAV